MANAKKGSQLWVTLGCGCLLLIGLGVAAVFVAGYFGASAVKDYVEEMKDPAARADKASQILGAERLPEGYTAHLFLQIPWLFEMVVLSDSEPVIIEDEDFEFEDEAIGEHLFVYFAMRKSDMSHDDLESMLRGESTSDGVKTDIDLEIESDEELSRGSFEIGEQRLSYVGHRGELDLDGGDVEGIYSQVLIDCPAGGERTRAAVWFQRAGDDDSEAGGARTAGTPADEETLERFMSHFDPCSGE